MNALLAAGLALLATATAAAQTTAQDRSRTPVDGDPRLREVIYDPRAVVSVPVKRGMVSLVVLADDELITDVAAGLGGDCSKPEAVWCVAAQSGGRHIFVKAKSGASDANNLAVVTDRRTHAFRFVVLADNDARAPIYRLEMKAPSAYPVPRASARATAQGQEPAGAGLAPHDLAVLQSLLQLQAQAASTPVQPSPAQLVSERLQAPPQLQNSNYSVAEGPGSQDIVPALIFDDGRFTYLRLPGNRELPAVFAVLGDGSETLVNTRMEGDLMVVDRVSRRLMLRAGSAVVGVWNEAFDRDGLPPVNGTTVPGVQRVLRTLPAGSDDVGAAAAQTAN